MTELQKKIMLLVESGMRNSDICKQLECSYQYVSKTRLEYGYSSENDVHYLPAEYVEAWSREWEEVTRKLRRCMKNE